METKTKNTTNNSKRYAKEFCSVCDYYNYYEYEYKPQPCNYCGRLNLPSIHNEALKIEEIYDVYDVINFDGELNANSGWYNFYMGFDYKNSKEVNAFLASESLPCHSIWLKVEKKDGIFNLEDAIFDILLFDDEAAGYCFTSKQISQIKENVVTYIKEHNLGNIKHDSFKKLVNF